LEAKRKKKFLTAIQIKIEVSIKQKGFLGTDNEFNGKTKAVVVPFGLEKTVSYGLGTKNGPKEIIKASHQVELFDEDLNCEPIKKLE
jgi:agmatinase